jgi:uncharacterized membrane protein
MPNIQFSKCLSLGLCAIALTLGLAGAARADLRVCNDTDVLAGVAIGYRAEAGWVTEGWWHIESGSCKTLIEGALKSRYYYLYAEDAQRGGRWTGPVNMCLAEREFKIVGFEDCFARGFQRAGFQEHDTANQSSWMIQLTDPKGGAAGAAAPQTPASSPTNAPAASNSANSNPAISDPIAPDAAATNPATPAPAP